MQDLTLKKKHVIPLGSIEIGPDAALLAFGMTKNFGFRVALKLKSVLFFPWNRMTICDHDDDDDVGFDISGDLSTMVLQIYNFNANQRRNSAIK